MTRLPVVLLILFNCSFLIQTTLFGFNVNNFGDVSFMRYDYTSGQASSILSLPHGFTLLKGFALNANQGLYYIVVSTGFPPIVPTTISILTFDLKKGALAGSANLTTNTAYAIYDMWWDSTESLLFALAEKVDQGSTPNIHVITVDPQTGKVNILQGFIIDRQPGPENWYNENTKLYYASFRPIFQSKGIKGSVKQIVQPKAGYLVINVITGDWEAKEFEEMQNFSGLALWDAKQQLVFAVEGNWTNSTGLNQPFNLATINPANFTSTRVGSDNVCNDTLVSNIRAIDFEQNRIWIMCLVGFIGIPTLITIDKTSGKALNQAKLVDSQTGVVWY